MLARHIRWSPVIALVAALVAAGEEVSLASTPAN